MNDLSDLCFLCLVHNKNIKLKENSYLQIKEEFNYFIPEHIFQNSKTPKYVCDDCIKYLNNINEFRRKCLKNIAIYKEHELKLSQNPDSHKYLTTDKTNILHQNNTEINCDVQIKTEIFESDDSKIKNDVKTDEACKVTENEDKICDETNYDREVKTEICEANDFNPPTEFKTGEISNDTQIHEVFIKREINEEFMIEEDNKQDNSSGIYNVVQQEPFCSQNDLSYENEPENSATNENDSKAAVSMCTQNQDPLQNMEKFKCQKCPEYYSSKEDLKIHYRTHIKKSQICDICQRSFSTSTHLRNHKISHTGEKPFVCDVCQKAFNRINNLRRHKLIHSDEQPHKCDACHKSFSEIIDLEIHKLVHINEKAHECDVCQRTFNRIDILKRHKLTHSDEKPHVCGICQESFRKIRYLKEHELVHTGEKLYECDVCQKEFNRIDVLKRHKLTHSGEKPYVCDVCQKTFSQIGHLRTHKRGHSGEKPYECDICQKTFKRSTHMKSHRLLHTGEKPYTCDVCQKSFSKSGNLKHHKRVVHKC